MTRAERAAARVAELKAQAEAIQFREHMRERLTANHTIPTCPKCGGRCFRIDAYAVASQSIIYDDEGESEWGDDYQGGDHSDESIAAWCGDCGSECTETLRAHGWKFYNEPEADGCDAPPARCRSCGAEHSGPGKAVDPWWCGDCRDQGHPFDDEIDKL